MAHTDDPQEQSPSFHKLGLAEQAELRRRRGLSPWPGGPSGKKTIQSIKGTPAETVIKPKTTTTANTHQYKAGGTVTKAQFPIEPNTYPSYWFVMDSTNAPGHTP